MSWWKGLAAEVDERPPDVSDHDVLVRRITENQVWVWEDGGQPVSMVRVSAPAAGASSSAGAAALDPAALDQHQERLQRALEVSGEEIGRAHV